MHPSRAQRESSPELSPQGAGQDQGEIHSIWDSLGKLRTELRRMKHRLDDASETGGTLSVTAAVEAISGHYNHHHPGPMPVGEQTYGNGILTTTGEIDNTNSNSTVLVGSGGNTNTNSPSASVPGNSRRKVSRWDSKSDQDVPSLAGHRQQQQQQHSSRGGNTSNTTTTARKDHHRAPPASHPLSSARAHNANSNSNSNPTSNANRHRAKAGAGVAGRGAAGLDVKRHGTVSVREESPKRVDFSRVHQLREVKSDGTYEDSLAFPSTLDDDNRNINYHHHHHHHRTDDNNTTESTLTNSRDIRETDIRFLNFSRAPNGPHQEAAITASTSPNAPYPSPLNSWSNFSVHLPSSSSASLSSVTSSSAPSASSSATSVVASSQPQPQPHRHPNPSHQNPHRQNQNHQQHQHPQQNQSHCRQHQQQQQHYHLNNNHLGEHVTGAADVRWNLDAPPTSSSSSARRAEASSAAGHHYGGRVTASSSSSAIIASNSASAGLSNHQNCQVLAGPKLTRVDLQTVGEGGGGPTTSSDGQQQQPDFLLPRVRRQVEERWASRDARSRSSSSREDVVVVGDGQYQQAHGAGDRAAETERISMDDWRESGGYGNNVARSGGGGGGDRGLSLGRGLTADSPSPKRPLSIKKPITADLKDNEIMLKLKERLKQQRSLATSSQSGSNDTSLADSHSSGSYGIPPALPPRQPLTGNATSGVMVPKIRKVAAAHPSPSYRGFSDNTRDVASSSSKAAAASAKTSGKKKSSSGKKKLSAGVGSNGGGVSVAKKSLQLQPKKHDMEGVKLVNHQNAAAALPPDRPKRITRVVAPSPSSDKKHSKSGAKNIITTSSWRAGQELIMRELGSGKVKAKAAPPPPPNDERHGGSDLDDGDTEDRDLYSREPDGAEAGNCGASAQPGGHRVGGQSGSAAARRDPSTDEVMAKAKTLSEDARNMLNELQLGPEFSGSETKVKGVSNRPAVKRKAPKVVESERQQQPREKARHYDADSVRQFMAKQKADRLRRQQEERDAYLKASERRENSMKDLAGRHKTQARINARLTRKAEEETRKRREAGGIDIGNKENVAIEMDIDDDSTLTDDSEDDSTPHATPRQDDTDKTEPNPKTNEDPSQGQQHMEQEAPLSTSGNCIEFQGQHLNVDVENALSRFSQIASQRRNVQNGSQGQNTTGFQLQDSGAILSKTRALVPGEETAFAVGSVNSVTKTNEERKQAIRATALTLQNRLALEARKLGSTGMDWPAQNGDQDEDFVTRYDRIAGNTSDFAVFTSDLPGTDDHDLEREEMAAARIQAAYRGHNTRQALNWGLPSGQTFGQRLRRGSPQGREYPDGQNSDDDNDNNEEGSQLSDSSTFSEITATEPSDGLGLQAAGPTIKKSHHASNHRHNKPTGGASQSNRTSSNAAGVGGSQVGRYAADWTPAQADPDSVMSIFSRQSKYRIAGSTSNETPGARPAPATATTDVPPFSHSNTMPSTNVHPTDAFVASLNLTSLKQPVITTEERVVVGQTSYGQPVVARARYTRMEATVSEQVPSQEDDSDVSDQDGDDQEDYSEDFVSTPRDHSSIQGQSSRQHSKAAASHLDSHSLASDEEVEDNERSHRHSTTKRSTVASYVRQISDTGQETDVSQMSEDEPRHARTKKHDSHASPSAKASHQPTMAGGSAGVATAAAAGHHHQTLLADNSSSNGTPERLPAEGRLSPNSLSNKMFASLNYLESVEESLRQTAGMERVRAVALAQQETVSLAQVLKARQQEHQAEFRQLQLQAQQEALESQKQLEMTRKGHTSSSAAALLEKEDNRRPESHRSVQLSLSQSTSVPRGGRKSDLSQSPGNRRINRNSASASLASVTQVSSSKRSSRSRGTASSASVKTAEDSYDDSDSSIKTASDADARDSRAAASSVAEEIQEREESYSMSFDESFTDEESFRQVLPSESHRKELRRQSSGSGHITQHSVDVSNHVTAYGDLSSLFAGEDSFSKFTADMVRQIMKEEEYRAQHQTALLSLREKALREKAKAELAWLQQLKQQPRDKRADDMFPNLDKKEKTIRKNLQTQQEEIRRLQEANKLASMERQRLLQQHEEIAKIKENTQTTLKKLQSTKHKAEGRLARPPQVHTEDEIEEASDVSEDMKDSKSDSEMYRDRPSGKPAAEKEEQQMTEKIQKLHLDHKFMTAREQMLHDRKKHARELLEWKKRLDEEEQKVYHMEKKAMEVWKQGGKHSPTGKHAAATTGKHSPATGKHVVTADARKEESSPAKKTAKAVPISRKDDSNVISDHMLSSFRDETAGDGRHRAAQTTEASISEVISTQISTASTRSETATTDKRGKSRSTDYTEQKTPAKGHVRSPGASGSESSIPEEVGTGSQAEEKQKAQDSSDDTIINSSVNEDYADTFEHDGSTSMASRKKLPVGKLLPQGNSPLPSPWSRKTGSESESEDSISHTETMSDASDYEVRIRQLSDELRRRRKEVEILKKERSRRQKDKWKAQEEALKKQLDAYNNYILQLKSDKDNLEHDASTSTKSAVRPQIKQPKSGRVTVKMGRRSGSDETPNQSSSFEDMRDSTDSNQTSPSVDGKDLKLSPMEDRDKKKVPVSLMDRISEGSESQSDQSGGKAKSAKPKPDFKVLSKANAGGVDDVSERTTSSSIAEMVDDASQLESFISEKTASEALKIQTGTPVANNRKTSESGKDEDLSYSLDFSENTATLAQSHKGLLAPDATVASRGRSEADISEHIDETSVGSAKSASVSQQLKFNNFLSKSDTKINDESAGPLSPPTMGIQESDSETESRVNSYHTSAKSEGSSRPSSERSVGSMSYSAEDDDEEEDIVSYGSDKTPVKGSPAKILPPVTTAASIRTEEDISEHVSASLPSISDKRSHSGSLRQDSQDMLNNLLGYKEDEEDEDDKTPVPTPREMELEKEKQEDKDELDTEREDQEEEEEEEENASLLMTDPLADFHLGDRVLVWGRKSGTLKFKGKVNFSPGIWAGVELDEYDGDSDGVHEGKRYFSCPTGHGIMVHGSDIVTQGGDKEAAETMISAANDELHSADESLTTDQDDSNAGDMDDLVDGERTFLNAVDSSMVHSTPVSSPHPKGSDGKVQKPDATPVKEVNNSMMADSITDHLTASILEDTVDTMGKITFKKTPPPTLPKPAKPSGTGKEEQQPAANSSLVKRASDADQATDGVMDSLLNEAISHMMSIKRRQAGLTKSSGSEVTSATPGSSLMNGDIEDDMLFNKSIEDMTLQGANVLTRSSLSKELMGGDLSAIDEDRAGDAAGMSVDPFQRPRSPLPGDAGSAQERQDLNDDLAGLLGEYIDDDFDLEPTSPSGKSPPPYPGENESEISQEKGAYPEEIPPVVPRTKDEIGPIVAQVVDIFWTHRRYGEPLNEVEPPEEFLSPDEDMDQDILSAKSCRSWRRMLFDLAREVIQEIYKDEEKTDTPVWQKAQHSSQKYYKGSALPTTIDSLRPVVQSAVFDLLDMNGNRKNNTVNRWNIRKKKDAVDAVLVQELGEEEKGWVNYDHDELNLKMNLTNSIFDSLLADTVHTLNGIYQRKSNSHV